MNNLTQNLNEKVEVCSGLTYEPLALFASKYNGYYNRVILESEEQIDSLLKIMQKTNLHMHVTLNELNFETKENQKMRTLERAVAKNINNATIGKIDAWFQQIIFPVHFYFDEKSKAFMLTIKTEMRAKKTGLNREFTNYVRIRFIKTQERQSRSLDELLEDAYEVFNEQFKQHMNSIDTVSKIESLNEQIDFCKIQEKAIALQKEPELVVTKQKSIVEQVAVTKGIKLTIDKVYEEFCLEFPDEALMFLTPDELQSYFECLDVRSDLKDWREKFLSFKNQ